MGARLEDHATFEGGGFGVGADVNLGASVRADFKFLGGVFGLTAGYNFLYFKVKDEEAGAERLHRYADDARARHRHQATLIPPARDEGSAR